MVIIIGILAAIAIPTYLSQKQNAYDADAQNVSHNAATAAMAFQARTGSYTGMTAAALQNEEQSLPGAVDEAPYNAPGMYTITVLAGGLDFRIDVKHSGGTATYRSSDTGTIELP